MILIMLKLALFCVCAVLVVLPLLPGAQIEKVDFNFQVRPLLSDRCFPCYGPDEKARMAELRIDQREIALR